MRSTLTDYLLTAKYNVHITDQQVRMDLVKYRESLINK
jgi:hypothetical protein